MNIHSTNRWLWRQKKVEQKANDQAIQMDGESVKEIEKGVEKIASKESETTQIETITPKDSDTTQFKENERY